MKKINIQRDLESRRSMQQAFFPVMETVMEVEQVKEESYAESEIIPGSEADTGAAAGEKQKKGRRAAEGNL